MFLVKQSRACVKTYPIKTRYDNELGYRQKKREN